MFPPYIADAALRVSGRRFSSRRGLRIRSFHLHARAAAPLSQHLGLSSPLTPARRNALSSRPEQAPLDRLFIGALVKASLCRNHSASYSTGPRFIGSIRRSFGRPGVNNTFPTTSQNEQGPFRKTPKRFRRPLRALCGMTDGFTELPPFTPANGSPTVTHWGSPRQGHPSIYMSKQERAKYVMPIDFPNTLPELQRVRTFRALAVKAHNDPKSVTNNQLFGAYYHLPGNRVSYLERITMERLLLRFTSVPIRTQDTMFQYLTILEDMRAAGIPLTREEWNQASSFVLRSMKYTTPEDLNLAVQMLHESDKNLPTPRADITTFNILLDGATCAGRLDMATSLLREIRDRNLQYDRFTYTTLMMYHAKSKNAPAVQTTYGDLVDAGEVVDTVILNALMTTLLDVGKEAEANGIYEYMKRVALATSEKPSTKLLDWSQARRIQRLLKGRDILWAKAYFEEVGVRLAPDYISFHLWIHHYCRVGDWGKVQYHIEDMQLFSCPVDRNVYLSILKGFAWHGHTGDVVKEGPNAGEILPWNQDQLQVILNLLLNEELNVIGHWDRVMAVWVIRAISATFQGNHDVLRSTWAEITRQWTKNGMYVNHFALAVYRSAVGESEEVWPLGDEQEHESNPAWQEIVQQAGLGHATPKLPAWKSIMKGQVEHSRDTAINPAWRSITGESGMGSIALARARAAPKWARQQNK
ncbi:hypothetical protein BZA77DRAFT_268382 [Pyronema omphalodes]|nr:hypothetical protein BZA77DRAFT_268382 [Pyronema omphalodes]